MPSVPCLLYSSEVIIISAHEQVKNLQCKGRVPAPLVMPNDHLAAVTYDECGAYREAAF